MKREITIKIDCAWDFWFWPCFTAIVILHAAEPSLADAAIHALMAVGS